MLATWHGSSYVLLVAKEHDAVVSMYVCVRFGLDLIWQIEISVGRRRSAGLMRLALSALRNGVDGIALYLAYGDVAGDSGVSQFRASGAN